MVTKVDCEAPVATEGCLCVCVPLDEAAGRDSLPKDYCVFIGGSPRASHTRLQGHDYQSVTHTHLCCPANIHKVEGVIRVAVVFYVQTWRCQGVNC